MDFSLPEELEMLRDMVRDFAAEKIAPFADEWDEKHYFPYEEVVKPMGELGLFGTVIPEQYGGSEMGWLAAMIVTEEIARASSSLRVQINMQTLGCAYTILTYGSDALKEKYIPQLVTAENVGAFAMTEPDAGSDVMAIKSKAEDKGDHWLLNGSKTWISNADVADTIIYYAYTDRSKGAKGLSAFIVEVKNFNDIRTTALDKLGSRSSPTGEIYLTDTKLPKEISARWVLVVVGAIAFGFGIFLVVNPSDKTPNEIATSLVVVIGIFAIVEGLLLAFYSFLLRRVAGTIES